MDAALLHAFPTSTRAFVKEAIARGDVLIAAPGAEPRRAPKGLKLRGGETIAVRELLEAADNEVLPVDGPLRVIFEDEALLAFDKERTIYEVEIKEKKK